MMVIKTKSPEQPVNIHYGLCLFCGACVGLCPENAILLGNTHLEFNLDRCTACGNCIRACPTLALSLKPEYLKGAR
jgi:formate hydrogenlyase subunit 6/NADH:ubiquinone oxidoreductase subunit I